MEEIKPSQAEVSEAKEPTGGQPAGGQPVGKQPAGGQPEEGQQEKKPQDKKRAGKNRYRRRFLIKAAVTAAVVYVLLTQVVCIRRSGDNAMFPAVCEGDLVIAYRLAALSAGDMVIYQDADGNEKMGRITAEEGMEVSLDEEGYLINGYPPDEIIFYPTEPAEEGISFPVTVPENEYFILNDFRPQMDDARTMGCTPKERILGKAVFIMRRRGI